MICKYRKVSIEIASPSEQLCMRACVCVCVRVCVCDPLSRGEPCRGRFKAAVFDNVN